MNPKISVIMPVYNVEKYLNESVKSILNQTFEDIEIICINDGSTDNSLNILNDYAEKDSRIKIFNQANQGTSIARNNALKKVTGDFIYFFDADDLICPNGLEKLYDSVISHDSDVAIFKSVEFHEDFSDLYEGNVCNIDAKYPDADFDNVTFNHRDIKEYVLNTSQVPWNKLYRKEFIDKYDDFQFPPGLPYNDVLFHVKVMLRASKISFVPEILYYYRGDNPTSISNTNSNHIKIFKIIKLVEDFLIKEGYMEEYEKEFEYFKIDHISYHMHAPLSKEYYKLAKEEFLKIDINDNELLKNLGLDKYYIIMDEISIDEVNTFEDKLKIKELTRIIKGLNYSKKSLTESNNYLKKHTKDLEEWVGQRNKAVDYLNGLIEKKNEKIENQNNEIKNQNKEIKNLQELIVDRNNEIIDLNNTNVGLKSDLNMSLNKNKDYEKEIKRLKKLNKSIINSNSWKLTKPLRKIKNLFK